MKRFILIIILVVIVFSCEKYPNPGRKTIEYFYYQKIGDSQVAKPGEYLTDKIGIHVDVNSLLPADNRRFRLELEVIDGGGSVDDNIIFADSSGKMETKWKLGDESNEQTVTAKVYDSNNRLYVETTFNAFTFFDNKWNEFKSGFFTQITDIVTDSARNRSLMIAGDAIYKLDSTSHSWTKKSWNDENFVNFEVNSKGVLFGVSKYGDFFKSDNWGNNWNYLDRPFPKQYSAFNLNITPDDYIWISNNGILCSKNDGMNWSKNTSGLNPEYGLSDVYQLGDGSHILLSGIAKSIFQSTDDGSTWNKINTPPLPEDIYLSKNDEIIVYSLSGTNFSFYKSKDFGQSYSITFNGVTSYMFQPQKSIVAKKGNKYIVIVAGNGVFQTSNFETFELILDTPVAKYIYIDYNGTIYATGNKNDPVYILPKQ